MSEPIGEGADWEPTFIGTGETVAIASGVAVIEPGDIELLSGSTPSKALPYPDSTDPLNQGANAIKALALAVDGLYTAGTGSPTGDSGGRASFAHGLGKTPRVVIVGQKMLSPDGDNAIDQIARVLFAKADATNITVRFYSISGSGSVFAQNPVGVSWIALA
jgi:hypothetical protein